MGPQRDEVTGQWTVSHNVEFDDLYSPANTFRLTKSRRMRWAGYIAREGDRRGIYRILVRKPVGRPEVSKVIPLQARCGPEGG